MNITFSIDDRLKKTQAIIFRDPSRFKVIVAGRRYGKSFLSTYIILTKALSKRGNYFFISPTFQQSRQIIWEILKDKTRDHLSTRINESRLEIELINGSKIFLKGADRPDTMRGTSLSGVVFDEFATMREPYDAWNKIIRPALSDQEGWAVFISSPTGYNYMYDLYHSSKGLPDWNSWQHTTIEGGYVSEEEIQIAKKELDTKSFNQEYLGSFETTSGRIYSDYSSDNYTKETIQEHERLLWLHDFNYTPMSSAIAVVRDRKIYILDEIILESAISTQSTLEFVDRYKNHKNKTVFVYGDPAGRAGEKHGHQSDYTQIESTLRANGWAFERRVKRKAPAIKDRQNAVRAKIKNGLGEVSLFVNPSIAKYADKGLATVQSKKGSTFQEVETDYQHITTAIGYYIDYEYPISQGFTTSSRRVV